MSSFFYTRPKEKSDEICSHLIKDPRIYGAQIILAISGEIEHEKLKEGICATINVPFSAKELEKCFNKLRSNLTNHFFTKLLNKI